MAMNELPPRYRAAFKDADIRGRCPEEINATLAYRVGVALVSELGVTELLVARDMRVSSPELHVALVQGVRDMGGDVIDLGLVPTPVLYFAAGKLQAWGVMITASHNPAEYNGLKIVQPSAIPLTNASGMKQILQAVTKVAVPVVKQRGRVMRRSLTGAFLKHLEEAVPLPASIPLRVVAAAGNGMASVLLERWVKTMSGSVTMLNAELDGTFPSRGSNPMLAKNQRPIKEALKSGAYDLGIAFDGDGDRIAIFDGRGQMINSAVVGAAIVADMLREQSGAACIYTVFTSQVYEETIRAQGGKAKRARVGHAFIKEQMRKHDAVFGCEHSGHFYFRDNYYADSALLTLRHVLRSCLLHGGDLRAWLRPYMRYHQTEEVLVEVVDKKQTLTAVADHYREQGAQVEQFDGVTVTIDGVRLVIKASVTEDALKYVVEAKSKIEAVQQQRLLRALLVPFAA